ncbi:MAG: RtcB family protein [Lentisphaerae bacterium]|nr:RtcB family protein [Lentisphaerota bacterium]
MAEIDRGNARIWSARRPDEEADDIQRTEDFGSLAGDASKVGARAIERGRVQLGTLGGGNHFLEIQVVERVDHADVAEAFGLFKGQIVIMIHSGSRGFGHQVAGDYMKLAASKTGKQCPNKHLCFLPTDSPEGQDYVGAMRAAANFAYANRQMMAMLVRHNFRHIHGDVPMPLVYDVTHNMAKLEEHGGMDLWIHRKGATRAFPPSRMEGTPFAETGQPVLIPGSMGTASYVLVGKPGAAESLFSVNHGAGRVMSRSAATGRGRGRNKKQRPPAISDRRFDETMRGVKLICANRRSVKEEAPDAYKDIDSVIDVVVGAGLADVVARMKPLAVLKG